MIGRYGRGKRSLAEEFDHESQGLRDAVRQHSESHATDLVAATAGASSLLLAWVGYLRAAEPTASATRILDAVQGSIVEIAGCLSLGLVRPAVFSIRTELELLLAWLYFKDHPVEWRQAKETGRGFPLRSSTLRYLNNFGHNFRERFSLLSSSRARQSEDPYELLSIHVHSLTVSAMPGTGDLKAIVKDEDSCKECVRLQQEVVEYLSDTLAAWYAASWADLPSGVRDDIAARLSPPQLKEFCS